MDRVKKFEPLFGNWYIESLIGEGSFGRVYKIYHEELGEKYYSAVKYFSIPTNLSEIKQLKSDGMNDESISEYYTNMAKSITSEARMMNTLKGNTNIVCYEDSDVRLKPDGIGYDVFIRMELLTSLSDLSAKNELNREEIVKIGVDICRALELCEKKKIIHRDIKPDNIFVNDNGDYKLGDFGVARQLERTATFMSKKGTYNYMAPEVYRGERYGAQADIYSLGLVLYRLLNDKCLPFLPPAQNRKYDDAEKALARRMSGEKLPLPANAQDELGAVIVKACEYLPENRYSTAKEMKQALLSAAEETTTCVLKTEQDTAKKNSIEYLQTNKQTIKPLQKEFIAVDKIGLQTVDCKETVSGNRPVKQQEKNAFDHAVSSNSKKEKKKVMTAIIVVIIAGVAIIAAVKGISMIDVLRKFKTYENVETEISFQDPTFEKAFRYVYDYTDNKPITQQDILSVKNLDLSATELYDISDIAMFKNIESLCLNDNSISDISALSGLTNLEHVELNNNGINDIGAFENLTQLTYIELDNNSISDITPLRKLSNLELLFLDDNYISDINVLGKLTKISILSLTGNCITEIEPLKNLSNLTRLSLYDNDIGSIRVLGSLTELTQLYLGNTTIEGIDSLKKLKKLEILYLCNVGIDDIGVLNQLTCLTSLSLCDNYISDISPLSDLRQLRELDLGDNDIRDISALKSLTELEELWLLNNNITDIDAIKNLTKLKKLSLHGNGISDISVLENMTSLTELYLGNNPLCDISALRNCTDLEQLYLFDCYITDIDALSGLNKLTALSLMNNSIHDVTPIYELTQLSDLYMENNDLSWQQIEELQLNLPNTNITTDYDE
mgnify:CR=1 FL=1